MIKYFLSVFGFTSTSDFTNSFVHTNLLFVSIPLAAISAFFEYYLGFSSATLVAFFILVFAELVTGLIASKVQKIKIESKKFGRFGLKILFWLILLYVANTFAHEFQDQSVLQNQIKFQLFSWLHGALLIYITWEYLISVLENIGRITGKSNSKFIQMLNNKFNSLAEPTLPTTDIDIFEFETQVILDKNGNVVKPNKNWIDTVGYVTNENIVTLFNLDFQNLICSKQITIKNKLGVELNLNVEVKVLGGENYLMNVSKIV